MNCMHVRVTKVPGVGRIGEIAPEIFTIYGKAFAVLRREFTTEGVLFHICDEFGALVGCLSEDFCELITPEPEQ